MYPTLKIGEMVVVKRVSFESIRVGDIIGFTSHKGIPLVHRVVWKTSKKITTVADASRRADIPITRKDLLGKIIMKKNHDYWISASSPKISLMIAWLSGKIVNSPSSLLYRAGRKALLCYTNTVNKLGNFTSNRGYLS